MTTFAFALAFAASGITTIRVAFNAIPQVTDESRPKPDRLWLALQAMGLTIMGVATVFGAGLIAAELVRTRN